MSPQYCFLLVAQLPSDEPHLRSLARPLDPCGSLFVKSPRRPRVPQALQMPRTYPTCSLLIAALMYVRSLHWKLKQLDLVFA